MLFDDLIEEDESHEGAVRDAVRLRAAPDGKDFPTELGREAVTVDPDRLHGGSRAERVAAFVAVQDRAGFIVTVGALAASRRKPDREIVAVVECGALERARDIEHFLISCDPLRDRGPVPHDHPGRYFEPERNPAPVEGEQLSRFLRFHAVGRAVRARAPAEALGHRALDRDSFVHEYFACGDRERSRGAVFDRECGVAIGVPPQYVVRSVTPDGAKTFSRHDSTPHRRSAR